MHVDRIEFQPLRRLNIGDSGEIERDGKIAPDELCNYAVEISNRDFLLKTHCADLGSSHVVCAIPFGVPIQSPPGPTVIMNFFGQTKTLVMFASHHYLNLSTDPDVHAAVRRTLRTFGVGAH